ncbi:MAG: HD domain-containing protein [Bacillota bacterium]|nr:HD domain-containing protein [Bacillota bacterium]
MLINCQAGSQFTGTVLVTEWKENPFRSKPGSFITLTCQDSSGSLTAKIWETKSFHFEYLKEADIFYIEASVNEYRGVVELSIESIQLVDEREIDLAKLLPSSPIPEEVLAIRLHELRQGIKDERLLGLLNSILEDPTIEEGFRKAPAAAKVHQAYLRGLMEHSIGVAEIAQGVAANYPEVNRDLLLVGALLHDIGKIDEYSFQRGISFTTEGRLLGHIIMGVELVSRKIAEIPDFPAELRTKLLHMITSHHGQYEWQSPRRPKCMEAVIIHHADMLNADLWQFKRAKEDNPEEEWSPYVRSMERYLYLK